MKPEIISYQINPENSPNHDGLVTERAPAQSTPENGLGFAAERYEQRSENSALSSDVGLTTAMPTPVVGRINVDKKTSISDNPVIAKHKDMIEKDWVIKAKKIIADTPNDPYQQEKAVNQLKTDYLKKRYGRGLGVGR
jgi:aconitase A